MLSNKLEPASSRGGGSSDHTAAFLKDDMANGPGESRSRSYCASPRKFKRKGGSCGNGGRFLNSSIPIMRIEQPL